MDIEKLVLGAIVGIFVFGVSSCTVHEMHQDKLIAELIEQGTPSGQARCAITDSQTESYCLAMYEK